MRFQISTQVKRPPRASFTWPRRLSAPFYRLLHLFSRSRQESTRRATDPATIYKPACPAGTLSCSLHNNPLHTNFHRHFLLYFYTSPHYMQCSTSYSLYASSIVCQQPNLARHASPSHEILTSMATSGISLPRSHVATTDSSSRFFVYTCHALP